MRRFAAAAACVEAGRLAAAPGVRAAPRPRPAGPPNIVFIVADDLGWADLGCYGNRFHDTPAIDRLRGQGMRFTCAYAAAPCCTPTRAGILTGQYPARLGMTGQASYRGDDTTGRKLLHPAFRVDLPPSAVTFAQTMKPAGYACACVGKWGVGGRPSGHGFDCHGGDERTLTDKALRFLREQKGGPFVLHLNYHRPHVPLQADRELVAKYRRRLEAGDRRNPTYAAVVEEVDRDVGRVLGELDRLGLASRTLVLLTADNGGFLGGGRYGHVTSNAPLRDGKASLYEGGIRVPLIVRWPGAVEAGTTCDVPVISNDFHPTFLAVADLQRPAGGAIDGVSLLPVLTRRGQLEREALYWHWPHYRRAMPAIGASPSSAVRCGQWKLIEFFEDGHLELYDLQKDVGERQDLAAKLPAKAAELHDRLRRWRKQVGAALPKPNAACDPGRSAPAAGGVP